MMLIDSHCHLDAPEFADDRPAVMERARAAGIGLQIIPAIDFACWPALASLCAAEPGLHAAYGLHPMFLDRHLDCHLDALPDWLAIQGAVAVGECGLDYFVPGLDPERQRSVFLRQLQIARDQHLPVIVHARRAVEEVIATIRKVGNLTGVIHSWPGSEEQARQLYDLGFCLGIGGPVTYERANRLRKLVATMPLDFLLLETDAPDQPDAHRRGQRNEPAFLVDVLRTVAQLRGDTEERIADATTANAQRLFGLPS